MVGERPTPNRLETELQVRRTLYELLQKWQRELVIRASVVRHFVEEGLNPAQLQLEAMPT